jgi:hypothetical protein
MSDGTFAAIPVEAAMRSGMLSARQNGRIAHFNRLWPAQGDRDRRRE